MTTGKWIERKGRERLAPDGVLVEVQTADGDTFGTHTPDWNAKGGARITACRFVGAACPPSRLRRFLDRATRETAESLFDRAI